MEDNRIYTTEKLTHFIGADKVIEAMGCKHTIPTERYAYPYLIFGTVGDKYYAEIWQNGMDWQNNYWIIEETVEYGIKVTPLIMFEDSCEEQKFNKWDFIELLKAICWCRRDKIWLKHNDFGIYGDTILPFLKIGQKELINYYPDFHWFIFKHASQPRVDFLLNLNFVPRRKV